MFNIEVTAVSRVCVPDHITFKNVPNILMVDEVLRMYLIMMHTHHLL